MNISKRIKAVRIAKNISAKYMADHMQTSISNYFRLENRGNLLTIEQALLMATILELSPTELFKETFSLELTTLLSDQTI
jgi:transcriptional regulator with XRE-family HTH domain